MERILQALNDAGLFVHISSGRLENGQLVDDGCTVSITTKEFGVTHMATGRWTAHAPSVREALDAACFQLQQHMRPQYESYLTMAEAFGWEV